MRQTQWMFLSGDTFLKSLGLCTGSHSLNYVLSICLFYGCLCLHLICVFRIQIPVATAVAVWSRFGFTTIRIMLTRKVTRAYSVFLYFPLFSAEEMLRAWYTSKFYLIFRPLHVNQKQQGHASSFGGGHTLMGLLLPFVHFPPRCRNLDLVF